MFLFNYQKIKMTVILLEIRKIKYYNIIKAKLGIMIATIKLRIAL